VEDGLPGRQRGVGGVSSGCGSRGWRGGGC